MRIESGFLFGKGDFPRPVEEDCEEVRSGTTEVERREGFLCVISDLSTLRSEDVMLLPVLIWSKTEDMSPPPVDLAKFGAAPGGGGGAEGTPFSSKTGRGGGGGGGGPDMEGCAEAFGVAAPDWICLRASRQSTPSFWFQVMPVEKYCLT